jgi:MFS family permease
VTGATGARAAAVCCASEVLGMLSVSSFQAEVPVLVREWGLSHTEIGWISGIFFAGYVAAVPVLVAATDRIDARRIFAASAALSGAAAAAFALFAHGFASALAINAVAGAGLGGAYMPGLKALTDRSTGPRQSRHISFYTASFGIGVSVSFYVTGLVAGPFGWRAAFFLATAGAAVSVALVLALLAPVRPEAPRERTKLLDFRPVLRNRGALAYIVGYFGHSWELFAFRAWIVAFLAEAATRHGPRGLGIAATTIAAAASLLGVAASVLGNEAAVRFGRRRAIVTVLAVSMALAAAIGFTADAAPALIVALALAYGLIVTGDSAALTAGAVGASEAGRRGATLAVHTFLGFSGAVLGPPAIGAVLDAAQATGFAWGLAFVTAGLGSAAALAAVALIRPGRA